MNAASDVTLSAGEDASRGGDASAVARSIDAGADEDGGKVMTTGYAARLEFAYKACLVAAECVGGHAVQFPGREKLLSMIQQRRRAGNKGFGSDVCNETGGYWYGPWRRAIQFLKRQGLVRTIPNSGTFVAKHIGDMRTLLRELKQEQDRLAAGGTGAHLRMLAGDSLEEVTPSGSQSHSRSPFPSRGFASRSPTPQEEEREEKEMAAAAADILGLMKFESSDTASTSPPPNAGGSRQRQRRSTAGRNHHRRCSPPSRVAPARLPPRTSALPAGPWQPSTDAEEQDLRALLDTIVKENKNVTYWTPARLRKAVSAIYGVLLPGVGMTRIELRASARQYVGDTGLLDYAIKVLVDKKVGEYCMKRVTDSVTGKLLYYLEKPLDEGAEGLPPGSRALAVLQNHGNKRAMNDLTSSPRKKRAEEVQVKTPDTVLPFAPDASECGKGKEEGAEATAALPARLEGDWAARNSRVGAVLGKFSLAEVTTCKQEVEAVLRGASDTVARCQAEAPHAWPPQAYVPTVQDILNMHISREITGYYQDMSALQDLVRKF